MATKKKPAAKPTAGPPGAVKKPHIAGPTRNYNKKTAAANRAKQAEAKRQADYQAILDKKLSDEAARRSANKPSAPRQSQ